MIILYFGTLYHNHSLFCIVVHITGGVVRITSTVVRFTSIVVCVTGIVVRITGIVSIISPYCRSFSMYHSLYVSRDTFSMYHSSQSIIIYVSQSFSILVRCIVVHITGVVVRITAIVVLILEKVQHCKIWLC
jgi:ABC-type uncharacterized transport system permease subunit